MQPGEPISIEEIYTAQKRIAGGAIRSPLVRLNVDDAPMEIFLKLENLQPVGSFKLRGAGNAMLMGRAQQLSKDVWTASTGNMAQGVAWYARLLGLTCSVVVPYNAPESKLVAIERLGARIIKLSWEDYFGVLNAWRLNGMEGLFIHPFADPAVMAGNGTIGLEILEDLPDVEAIIVSYGGGGLSCGIAAATRALKSDVRVYACEVETAAPLAASLAAGEIVTVNHTPTFVDAIGSPAVFAQMWPLAQQLLNGSLVVSLAEVASAIRLMAERNHIIAEGAGAIPVAAALAGKVEAKKVVCVVSGGNISRDKLMTILQGQVP